MTGSDIRVHDEEEIQLGLRTLALYGGNAGAASKALEGQGIKLSRYTLGRWRREVYARRYLELCHEMQQEIGKETSARAMEIAGKATQLQEKLIDRTMDEADNIEAKDLARSALAIAQVQDVNVRTGQLLRNQPTSITEVRNPTELIRELQAMGISKPAPAIDVEVEDIEDE